MPRRILALVFLVHLMITASFAQTVTNSIALQDLSRSFNDRFESERGPEYQTLIAVTSGPMGAINRDQNMELIGITEDGWSIYYEIHNLISAQTIAVDEVWPGGVSDYDLDGDGTLLGELAVWDAGNVRATHREFGTRVWNWNNSDVHFHSTHVAGTMIASGMDYRARGMSSGAEYLAAYDWHNAEAEMADAAEIGMLVSNHSYGIVTGWRRNWDDDGEWYWYGRYDISETEDYYFGFYSRESRDWDEIAFEAPYYTICKSAGNDRGEGPNAGTAHYYQAIGGDWERSTTTRDRDGGANGYDCISHGGVAKNIITVGAVSDVPGGYTNAQGVNIVGFSCNGPTDDGRIKPDIVANGSGLYSCGHTANDVYASYSGTSMSSPSVAGALNVLVQFYQDTHDSESPRSATMKALIINTADECGNAEGPDYRFGWGLMNTRKAVDIINEDSEIGFVIQENELDEDETFSITFQSDGEEPILVTIVWTDPPGDSPDISLNPDDIMLVNDLDLRVEHEQSGTTYQPYILNPANPAAAATTGDNVRDNVEKIYIEEPAEGDYTIRINHKNTLENDSQAYSLILSGLHWEDDPRIPPTELSAEIDYSDGLISLQWNFEGTQDNDFEEFNIYRNDRVIWRTTDTEFDETLVDFDIYEYFVTSSWDVGESRHSEAIEINYQEPLSPVYVRDRYRYGSLGEVVIDWEHFTEREISYDDGSSEADLIFTSGVVIGASFAQRFNAEDTGDLLKLGAYLFENEEYSFGRVNFVVYAAGEDISDPGDTLFVSDRFTPDEDGWYWMNVEEADIDISEGDEFWIALSWTDIAHTILGRDTDGAGNERGYLSGDGRAWMRLPDIIDGNPMLRVKIGDGQEVGEDGLTGYSVTRDGENISQVTDKYFEDLLPGAGTYTYLITATYEQGDAESEAHEVYWDGTGVKENQLPNSLSIGDPYPNPFNSEIIVPVSLPQKSDLSFAVYDILGREVDRLQYNNFTAGKHYISWSGNNLSAGIYFLHFKTGSSSQIRKIVLVK